MVWRAAVVGVALLATGCEERGEPYVPRVPPPVAVLRSDPEWDIRRNRISNEGAPLFEKTLRDAMTKYRFPSVVAGVLVDGQLVWWQGLGTRDGDEAHPVDAHSVYRIASITKLFTAMAVLRLRDEGRLDLDAAASTYIPEFDSLEASTADSGKVTIRHLLTHTSGLPRLGRFDFTSEDHASIGERDVLASLNGMKLERVPGIESVYSNLGYALLGILVQRAVGKPYRTYVSEAIIAPLAMTSARWDEARVGRGQLTDGYRFHHGGYEKTHRWQMGAAEGMGGLYASLDDMARFLAYQMTAWPPGGRADQPPLSNATLRESHHLGGHQWPGRGGTGYGWGVAMVGGIGPRMQHSGSTDGYASYVSFFPTKRFGVVALTNCGRSPQLDAVARSIEKALGRF
ncbi:MAG: serine hydrolase domain-containing protein [Myxococcota bacterium]